MDPTADVRTLRIRRSDDSALDLSTHVINTEAHPLQTFTIEEDR